MTRQKISQPSCNQLTNGNYQIKQKNATFNMRVRERERETHTHTHEVPNQCYLQDILGPHEFIKGSTGSSPQ